LSRWCPVKDYGAAFDLKAGFDDEAETGLCKLESSIATPADSAEESVLLVADSMIQSLSHETSMSVLSWMVDILSR
jgi:hypothetical protein